MENRKPLLTNGETEAKRRGGAGQRLPRLYIYIFGVKTQGSCKRLGGGSGRGKRSGGEGTRTTCDDGVGRGPRRGVVT